MSDKANEPYQPDKYAYNWIWDKEVLEKHFYEMQARIRELERMNAELRRVLVDDIAAQRIAKAKAILDEWSHEKYVQAGEPLTVRNIQSVLEALEGK